MITSRREQIGDQHLQTLNMTMQFENDLSDLSSKFLRTRHIYNIGRLQKEIAHVQLKTKQLETGNSSLELRYQQIVEDVEKLRNDGRPMNVTIYTIIVILLAHLYSIDQSLKHVDEK